MKNFVKFLGIAVFAAVIGFSFTACPNDPPSANKLAVSGLSTYNGKYIVGAATSSGHDGVIVAASTSTDGKTVKGAKIGSDGKVTLNAYKVKDEKATDFTDNADVIFTFFIYEKEDGTGTAEKEYKDQKANFKDGSADIKIE